MLIPTLLLPSVALGGGAIESIDVSTPAYRRTIVVNCEPGEILCHNVVVTGEDKKTGEKIELKDGTDVHYCTDGTTPCHQLGHIVIGDHIIYEYFRDGRLSHARGWLGLAGGDGLASFFCPQSRARETSPAGRPRGGAWRDGQELNLKVDERSGLGP